MIEVDGLTKRDPGVLREVVGASSYLAVIAVIGLALGALLRRTAAGLSVFAALFFVVPIVAAYLPHGIRVRALPAV